MNALTTKAIRDLRRHPLRSFLTIFTLSLAVAGLGVAAVPGLMGRAMAKEVSQAHLYDIALLTHDLTLNPTQMAALRRLPDVSAFSAGIEYSTTAVSGSHRAPVVLWGIDLASQPVDTVQVLSGRSPGGGQVLADEGNSSVSAFPTSVASHVAFRTPTGRNVSLEVSGLGHSLATSPSSNGMTNAAFYAPAPTVQAISGIRGFNYLAFRLADDSPRAQAAAVNHITAFLRAQTGGSALTALPVTNGPGAWPGQAQFDDIIDLFLVITVLALFCSIFLVANTVNTLVVEQSGEIALLKALGGRRSQVAALVLSSSAALGGTGGLAGAVLGIVLAWALSAHFASSLYDVSAGFEVYLPVVVASLLAGPALAVVSCLPGLRRIQRRPVAEMLGDADLATYGDGRLDRALAKAQILPGTVRMGMRNALRQKRRSAASVAQVTLAVALALALLAVGRSASAANSGVYAAFHFQIEVDSNPGAPLLGAVAQTAARATPGVSNVQAVDEAQVGHGGKSFPSFGLPTGSDFEFHLSAGRAFNGANQASTPAPVVLGQAAARSMGVRVGQVVVLETAGGPLETRVIGIDSDEFNNGNDVYLPLRVLAAATGSLQATNALWITTTDTSHGAVDRVALALGARLAGAGYPVQVNRVYVEAAQNQAQNSSILLVVELLGILVVAITLIGLVSTLTMAVLERTREIGILRSLGARSAQVRQVFIAEALALTVVGAALGTVLAWPLSFGLVGLINADFGIDIAALFPFTVVPLAWVGLGLLTLVIVRPPLRRAVRIQPGLALRYQ